MQANELFIRAEELRVLEQLEESIEVYRNAMAVANTECNQWVEAESAHMLGVVYHQLKNISAASQLFDQAEELFLAQANLEMTGAVLRDRAILAVENNHIEKAEALMNESIHYLAKGDKKGHLGISEVKLGMVYALQGRLDEAEKIILEGISHIKQSDDLFFESSAYFQLAQILKQKNEINEARTAALRAVGILEKIGSGGKHAQRKKEMNDFIDSLVDS